MNTATLRLALERPEEAQAALAPDDGGFLVTRVDGSVLELTARAEAPMGLLRTLDDVMGCLRATGIE
ncbi:MAG: hypothetical protein ACPHID_02160 [Thermoplasmatota archaeon]